MSFNHYANKCTAKTTQGTKCKNPAMVNSDFCFQHSDEVTKTDNEKKSNDNPWRENGPGALKLFDENEYKTMLFVLEAIERDFDLNQSSDQMQAQMAALYFVKWMKAAQSDTAEYFIAYDKLLRKSLSCLKATREKREGIELKISTPADWAAKLLGEYKVKESENFESSNKNINNNNNSKSVRDSKDSIKTVTKKNT